MVPVAKYMEDKHRPLLAKDKGGAVKMTYFPLYSHYLKT